MSEFYKIKVKDIKGNEVSMDSFEGKVLLIVNVASACGLTPQYEGLENLYQEYKDQGLLVLGFPCNQFGGQEPGSEAEILDFCTSKFSVSFPVFAKLEVNGENTHELYQYLKKNCRGILGTEAIKWNFTKFLVDRDGNVVERFAPTTTPEQLKSTLVKYL